MRKIISVLLTLVVIMSFIIAPVSAQDETPPSINLDDITPIDPGYEITEVKGIEDLAIKTDDGRIRVIVELQDAPLATYKGDVKGYAATSSKATGLPFDPNSKASQSYLAYLDGVQKAFVAQLTAKAGSGVEVFSSLKASMNALSLAIKPESLKSLMSNPAVKNVYADQIRYATMDASLDLINAPGVWSALPGGTQATAGAGVKVAVIDSGLFVDNPMFDGTGFVAPPGYPLGFCATNPTDPFFQCNGKVIAARAYFDPALVSGGNTLNPLEQTDNPIDVGGHGSHTAGTSAGNIVTVPVEDLGVAGVEISGVAPGAYLMVYKALVEIIKADGTETGSGTDTMLSAALEDALLDGADVINNSWGGGAGDDPNGSPYQTIIQNITAAGTLVVFAAGNDGPDSETIGCPGCVEEALTVAASTTNRRFVHYVDVTGPTPVGAGLEDISAIIGTGPIIQTDVVAPIKYDPANLDGCAAFAADYFAGSIALIARGTCNFWLKVVMAQSAGAVGVIVYTNTNPITAMGYLEDTTIPAVMISNAEGLAIQAWIDANPTATAAMHAPVIETNAAWQDIMADFSSVGPNGDPDVLKPDITAPGVDILSAYSPVLGIHRNFNYIGGTSMAAPHITGSAALFIQMHPTWTPAQIKTVLTSTSVQTMLQPDGVTPANAFNMGAGRVDLLAAMGAGAAFDSPSFANSNCVLSCDWDNSINNVGEGGDTFRATVTTDDPNLIVEVDPAVITIAPDAEQAYTVTADVSDLETGVWHFATITWTNDSGLYSVAHQPLVVMAGEASNVSIFSKTVSQDAAAQGDTLTYEMTVANYNAVETTFTLDDPIPTNTVYVADSVSTNATYNSGVDSVEATITLPGMDLDLVSLDWGGYNDVSGAAWANLADYCTNCDDTAFHITGMDFYYMGQHYTDLTISSNGYLVPGDVATGGGAQLFPDATAPNNVIAPLWTDLDFTDGGNWYASYFCYAGTCYDIFQWESVPQYGTTDLYSFQVWFVQGTDFIAFSYDYANLPADLTVYNFSIGVENDLGTMGRTYYSSINGTVTGIMPTLDLVVDGTMYSDTVTYDVTVDIVDDTLTQITNVASLSNDIDSVVEQAVAFTLLLRDQLFLPVIIR